MPQVVEVPAHAIGYAVFTIEKDDFNKYTKLVVSKEILNSNNEIATSEDFENAKLNENESFEVKVTNVDTKDEYYTFISTAKKGIILDLPEGTYEIEEIYKPKYELKSYNNVQDGNISDELVANENGKYTFEIEQGNNETTNIVEIAIRNIINTNFPFGGQVTKDNLSKVDIAQVETTTQSIVYVVDEDGNELPGVQFKLIDSNGQVVNIGTEGNILITKSKKILIRGLEPGNYTLVNISVPDGYLQPENKEVAVYEDVSRVTRVEIQKNIPRGNLTLATTFVNSYEETKYVPRSKYKVVDTATGELVKFVKTSTGNYRKSNLEDATEVITLKAGTTELLGLEAGKYEVGLVGITEGFGMKEDLPETIELVGNDVKEINVQVVRPNIVQVASGSSNTMYLNDSGELWIFGSNSYGLYANGKSDSSYNDIPNKIKFPEENVFITSFTLGYNIVLALDSEGRVWSWGTGYIGNGETNSSYTPICLSNIEGTALSEAYKNGVTITEVQVNYDSRYLLDSEGKIWSWGCATTYAGSSVGDGSNSDVLYPTCITNIENTYLNEQYNEGIKIIKLASTHMYSHAGGAIDSLGRVWMWGYNQNGQIGNGETENINIPTCISEIESEFSSAEVTQLSIGGYHVIALDKNNNIWGWGSSSNGQLADNSTSIKTMPTKLSNSLFNGNKIKLISASNYISWIIDENGKVWACGNGYLGTGSYTTAYEPICISENSDLENENIVYINNGGDHIVALSNTGAIWGWGGYGSNGELGATGTSDAIQYPTKLPIDYTEHLEYNLKFVKVIGESNGAIALDEMGNVWGIADSGYYVGMGYNNYSSIKEFKMIRELEGKNIVDIGGSNNYFIALSEDGDLYIFGPWTSAVSSYNYVRIPTKITDKFNLPENTTIVNVALADSTAAAAVDSSGKVWVWGDGYGYKLGNNSTSNITIPECISDETDENLYGVNIKEIYGTYAGFHAIDDEGKIWYWGECYYSGVPEDIIKQNDNYNSYSITKPTCITNIKNAPLGDAYELGTRFTKISATEETAGVVLALDTDGKVWVLYGPNGNGKSISISNGGAYCINNDDTHVIYNESLKYEGYKIEKIYTVNNESFITDNQGTTWNISSSGTKKITDVYNVPNDIRDISGYDGNYNYLIDGYGQLWNYNSSGATCLSGYISNPLYNVRAKAIIADGIVEADTEKQEIYLVDSSSVNFMMYSEGYIENYVGKNIVQIEKNITTTFNNNYVIALDEDGKLWTWGGTNYKILGNNTTGGSTTPICISDIEGTELYNAYVNDSNFKIEKFELIYNESQNNGRYVCVYAYDNTGRIWTWGNNNYRQLADGTENAVSYTPVCISNIPETDLAKAHEEYSDFKFEKITHKGYMYGTYALDNHGNVWEARATGLSGRTSTFVRLNKIEGTDLYNINENSPEEGLENAIYEMLVNDDLYCYYNRKLWQNINGTIVCANNVVGSELYEEYNANPNFEFVQIHIPQYLNTVGSIVNTGTCIAVDSNGKLWSWGSNMQSISLYGINGNYAQSYVYAYLLGDGTSESKTVQNPICISNIEDSELNNEYKNDSSFKIEKVESTELDIYATDNKGQVWAWGLNAYGELGNGTEQNVLSPYCISTPIKSTNATVQKIQIYSESSLLGRGNWPNGRWNIYADVYDHKRVTVILDSNGYIWTCGGSSGYSYTHTSDWIFTGSVNNAPGILGSTNNLSTLTKTSTTMTGIQDFVITDVGTIIAYGTTGVYSWGNNKDGRLGLGYNTQSSRNYYFSRNGDTAAHWISIYDNNIYTPKRLTSSAKLQKIVSVNENRVIALDTTGRIWAWGIGAYIPYVTQVRAVPTCISLTTTTPIYGKVISEGYEQNNNCYLVDSNGVKYIITDTEIQIYNEPTEDSEEEVPSVTLPSYTGVLADKTIISYSNNMAIDSDGKLYGWDSYDGNFDEQGTASEPVCITDKETTRKSNFQNNKTVVNIPVTNEVYKVKFADIITDQIVLDVEGNYWLFPESGKATILSDASEYIPDEIPTYSPVTIEGVNVVDCATYKALDDKGNLYVWGQYVGGLTIVGNTAEYSVNLSETEYIVEPLYLDTNGWSLIKKVF